MTRQSSPRTARGRAVRAAFSGLQQVPPACESSPVGGRGGAGQGIRLRGTETKSAKTFQSQDTLRGRRHPRWAPAPGRTLLAATLIMIISVARTQKLKLHREFVYQ